MKTKKIWPKCNGCRSHNQFGNSGIRMRSFMGISLIVILWMLSMPKMIIAQTTENVTISGHVYNNHDNSPIEGAAIKVLATNSGVLTDARGDFSMVIGKGQTIVITAVSFKKIERIIGDSLQLSIGMDAEEGSLNDVVVVGYGTQKKIDLTGAVSQISGEALSNRPMPNVARGLEGLIPNLNIVMTDGKPTRSPSYNVRGTTSIGSGGDALVLIDGVPGDPSLLNPNDIESVTVLKDAASAAIYGARGAYGVVLFTTKSPKEGKVQVNFNTNYTINQKTVTPKIVNDGYEWTKDFADGYNAWYDYKSQPATINGILPYTPQYLDSLKARSLDPSLPKVTVDPATGKYLYYGSTDWYKELYRNSMPAVEEALSVSGSGKNADFLLSGRYYSQGGIFNYNPDKFKSYNLRLKGNIYLAPWFTLSDNLDFNSYNYFYPVVNGGSPVWRYMDVSSVPMAVMFNPDGTLTPSSYQGVGDMWTGNNKQTTKQTYVRNTASFSADVIKNELNIKGDFTYAYTNNNMDAQYYPVSYSEGPGRIGASSVNKLNKATSISQYYAANLYSQFDKKFGDHSITLLAGANIEDSHFDTSFMQRDGLLDPSLPNFNLLDGVNYALAGGGYEWAIAGFFFRGNYDYKGKYLLEVNGRYDGSSKFPSYSRYGLFPSVSAGWNISKEPFMNFSNGVLDNLKIRASVGSLGNGQLKNPYQFVPLMAVSQSTAIAVNGAFPTYTSMPAVLPSGLTWETATTYDGGIDLSMFKGRLTSTFDVYRRNTTDMFTVSQPLPGVFGAAVPRGNFASLKTIGWDLNINWQDKVSESVSYSLGFILSDSKAWITKYNNPNGIIPYGANKNTYYEGERLGEIWGFQNDGYYTEASLAAPHPDQSYIVVSNSNIYLPGDIRFKDLNGDNVINIGQGTLKDHGDLKVIGNSQPRYNFSFNGSVSWKSLSISAFFQGVAEQDWWPGTEAGLFWGQYNRPYESIPADMMKNVWTQENPNAYFPRYRGYVALQGTRELALPQVNYLQNAAYIRLKNVNLTWTMPKTLIQHLHLTNMQLYFTGQNLFTYTPMHKHAGNFDPEVIYGSDPEVNAGSGNGYAYPMLKSYTVGANITF